MKFKVFTGFVLLEILLLAGFFVSGEMAIRSRHQEILSKRKIVKELMLTDLSLWTEARYTRHPSQADLFTPFQDFPSALEHFPAGSILGPGNVGGRTRIETKGAKQR
jgi:hypothetical protein